MPTPENKKETQTKQRQEHGTRAVNHKHPLNTKKKQTTEQQKTKARSTKYKTQKHNTQNVKQDNAKHKMSRETWQKTDAKTTARGECHAFTPAPDQSTSGSINHKSTREPNRSPTPKHHREKLQACLLQIQPLPYLAEAIKAFKHRAVRELSDAKLGLLLLDAIGGRDRKVSEAVGEGEGLYLNVGCQHYTTRADDSPLQKACGTE